MNARSGAYLYTYRVGCFAGLNERVSRMNGTPFPASIQTSGSVTEETGRSGVLGHVEKAGPLVA